MTTAIASAAPTPARPWAQQPNETGAEFQLWARWALSHPRPVISNPELLAIAERNRWAVRAQALDAKIGPAVLAPADAVRDIAASALTLLQSELAARAAESLASPGHNASLTELNHMLRMIQDIAASAPPAPVTSDTWVNLSGFTKDEVAQFAYFTSRAWRPGSERPR